MDLLEVNEFHFVTYDMKLRQLLGQSGPLIANCSKTWNIKLIAHRIIILCDFGLWMFLHIVMNSHKSCNVLGEILASSDNYLPRHDWNLALILGDTMTLSIILQVIMRLYRTNLPSWKTPEMHWMLCETNIVRNVAVSRRSWRDSAKYKWHTNWRYSGRRSTSTSSISAS